MSTSLACATGIHPAPAVDGVPAQPCTHRVPTLPPMKGASSQGPGSPCSVSRIFICWGLPRPSGVHTVTG